MFHSSVPVLEDHRDGIDVVCHLVAKEDHKIQVEKKSAVVFMDFECDEIFSNSSRKNLLFFQKSRRAFYERFGSI